MLGTISPALRTGLAAALLCLAASAVQAQGQAPSDPGGMACPAPAPNSAVNRPAVAIPEPGGM
jgi:hypothetical protein